MEKWEKTTICGHSQRPVPVPNRVVQVQFGFWSILVNLYSTGQSCTGTPCSILTSVRILVINFSFIIRFG